MDEIVIRLETPQDAAGVRAVLELAFRRADEALLAESLRRHSGVFGLVATHGEEIAGYILFSPVTCQAAAGPALCAGLGPMAVGPDWQLQGIGTRLVRQGLEECRDRGITAVVVLGHPDFYRRFGFAPARDRGLTCKWVVPEDAFMVRELVPGSLAGMRGLVTYLPEFDEA
jgi:putative acetyltransferase